MDRFDNEKRQALSKTDKSKKQSFDVRIKQLIKLINSKPNFYTTSSCAGRILVATIGDKKYKTKWLMATHEKAKNTDVKKAIANLPKQKVYLKQEGFILHIACKELKDAQGLLNLANSAGVRRRGILSIEPRIIVELSGSHHFETLIAKKGICLCDNNHLQELVKESNNRLTANWKSIARLTKEIQKAKNG